MGGPLLTLALLGCRPEPRTPTGEPIGPYEVDVRTTAHGVPHLLADDLGSVAFGMGWAHARDHLCTLADQIVKVRSERARYFGPGDADANVDSDFGWLGLRVRANAEAGFETLPDDVQTAIVGYAAGYDRYLEDTPPADRDPRCAGAPWVVPISPIDLLTYYLHLGQLSSGYNLVREVGNAQPPTGRRSAPPPLSVLEPFRRPPIGSNGWAIGADRTDAGQGMLLSNTHFPATGELQWWEVQLTVPGELNVYGATLVGSPFVNVGFNEHVAWTHTVSLTPRFTIYQLELDPADPTRYATDGGFVEMEPTEHAILVLQQDGSLDRVDRTLYRTHWGPVFNAPVVGWNTFSAFTWRDVNENNLGLVPAVAAMNLAADQASFEDAHRGQGIPWVHTQMVDRGSGSTLYLDSAATPNLQPAAEAAHQAFLQTSTVARLFADFGLLVFDGSDPVFDWVDDERSVVPGAVPYDLAPRLERPDFVSNANENHWLANPLSPLTGYPWVYGPTGGPLTARTKMNDRMLLEQGGASGDDHRFSLDELEAAVLSGRGAIEEDLRDQLVQRCTGAPPVELLVGGEPRAVDLGPACATLASWDGAARVESVGAHLWREVVSPEWFAAVDFTDQGRLYADTFDPGDPLYTPDTLAAPTGDTDPVLELLAEAVVRLEAVGIPIDVPLGEVQFRLRGDRRIPSMGGNYLEGVIAVGSYTAGDSTLLPTHVPAPAVNLATGLSTDGYYVNDGNSFILAMRFDEAGPEARAILTYSQSENPDSPYFLDQSLLYADQRLRPALFHEADILADPDLELIHLSLP
ncbi:MAG: penicillin acylase family protein [Myxococcota bacterium]